MRLVLALLACLIVSPVAAQTFPALTGRVVDAANVIPAEIEAEIEGLSRAHEAETGNQIVVAVVPSLEGYDVADYGYRLGRAWGIGQDGGESGEEADNGVVLLVAPNERKVRIEVGYGLEGVLTDAIASVIIQGSILPRFRAGDYPGGVRRGVEDIVTALGGDASEFLERIPERIEEDDAIGAIISTLFIAMFLYFMFSGVMRGLRGGRSGRVRRTGRYKGRRRGGIVVVPGGGWSGGSGSSWGGGSGGFGGGGFSGGGGGFGGGGASGSW